MIDEPRFTAWLRTASPGSKVTVFEGPSGMAQGWLRKYHKREDICIFHQKTSPMGGGRWEYAIEVYKISDFTQRALEKLRYTEERLHDKLTWRVIQ